ncbi:MAG: hypothetical protein ACI8QZ_000209 [Chlamydiales bacterium]|jgi:hypothetical protein
MQTATPTTIPEQIPDRRRFERQLGIVLWIGLIAVLFVVTG